jgi:flagellar motor switch protein FliG
MSNLGLVSPDVIERILSQFTSDLSGDSAFFGSLHTTKRMLEKILDKDRVDTLIDEIQGPQGKNTWEKLGNVNEEILALYLRNEHPQTAALVVSKITHDHAAKVLSNLPEQFAFEVIMRMLNIDSVKREVLDRVEKILRAEFISTASKAHKQDSFEMMAEIFNSFDRSSEQKYMGMLETKFPDAASKIKDLMFTFEDLMKIDSKGIQNLLRAIDKSKLTVALRGASDKLRDLFLSSMSQRASRIILEELEALGPIKVKDVDEAQSEIVNVAKELIAKGEIDLAEDGNDEYI